jgi:hypothetical protein
MFKPLHQTFKTLASAREAIKWHKRFDTIKTTYKTKKSKKASGGLYYQVLWQHK